MFGTKYTRLKFWLISIPLFIVVALSNSLGREAPQLLGPFIINIDETSGFNLIVLTGSAIWLNTLANRIRDYGTNPWYSLFALIPLVNVVLGFYYGIVKCQKDTNGTTDCEKNSDTYLTKAVYNHAKEIVSDIKPSIENYKEKHTSIQVVGKKQSMTAVDAIDEDMIYEKIMLEIEENNKVKSVWARVLAQSEGNKDKAEAFYIQSRVKAIKEELGTNRIEEEPLKENPGLNKHVSSNEAIADSKVEARKEKNRKKAEDAYLNYKNIHSSYSSNSSNSYSSGPIECSCGEWAIRGELICQKCGKKLQNSQKYRKSLKEEKGSSFLDILLRVD